MAALQGVHVAGYAALLIRKTFADLVLPGALMDRAHDWLHGSDATWDGLSKTWRFPSGASLTFGYLDNYRDRDRYQGAELQYIGVDELTQHEERSYLYLLSRLRPLDAVPLPVRARAGTNPGGIGHRWVQERWGIPDEGCTGIHCHGDLAFVPSFARDNPGLRHDDYDRQLAKLDPTLRAQLRDGRWLLDTSGLVYGYDPAQHSVKALPDLYRHERWHHVMGIDYGYRDETAWAVWAYVEHEPAAYLVHAESAPGLTPSAAAERTAELIAQWSPESVVGDVGGLGKGYAEEARSRFGLPIMPADKTNKRGYISLFRGALSDGTAKIVIPGAEDWAAEASALLWKDELQREEHPSQPNHVCDAALYGWREVRQYQTTERVKPSTDPVRDAVMVEYARRTERRRRLGLTAIGRV